MMKFLSTGVLLGGLLVALTGVGQADGPTVLVSASLESGFPFLELKCAVTNLSPQQSMPRSLSSILTVNCVISSSLAAHIVPIPLTATSLTVRFLQER
jgi:hypothetical protein